MVRIGGFLCTIKPGSIRCRAQTIEKALSLECTIRMPGVLAPGILICLYYLAKALYRNVTTWARLQMLSTPKMVALIPLVTPFSTAQRTGVSYQAPS